MATQKDKFISIKLNSKNYLPWSFHFYHFVSGIGLSGYLEGTTFNYLDGIVTIQIDEKALITWNQNNSKVVAWILNSINTIGP